MSSTRRPPLLATHYEHDIAQRWWNLPRGSMLPLSNGELYQLVFPGRPGGSLGPDVRDAVLCEGTTQRTGFSSVVPRKQYTGDVEFHIRASDWTGHGHHTDARYNNVILHVVLVCDDPRPTTRQDGIAIPTCSLQDLPHVLAPRACEPATTGVASWPCHWTMQHLDDTERDGRFRHAGRLRFEQKTHAFVEQLHAGVPGSRCDLYDTCLIPALAEGLAYGRDRAFFRAAGLRLLGNDAAVPEPLGHANEPSPLDTRRLQVLARLMTRWRPPGVWRTLYRLLLSSSQSTIETAAAQLQTLRDAFCGLGLSLARTDILLCNVVFPFAAAVALLEHQPSLAEEAERLYTQHPGLSSNRITRMMCAQLRLPIEPVGSCQQQGLHYIYQQTCREKRCNMCMMGKKDI